MKTYLIIRIEPAANRNKPEKECEPPLTRLSKRLPKHTILSMADIREFAGKYGFVLAERSNDAWKDHDLLALAYLSPNPQGKGRAGSQLFRLAARRAA